MNQAESMRARRQFIASLVPLLGSCSITIDIQSPEEKQMMRDIFEGKEIGWDARPVIENLDSAKKAAQSTLLYTHWVAIQEHLTPPEKGRERINASLQTIGDYAKTAAATPALLDALATTVVNDQSRPIAADRAKVTGEIKRTIFVVDDDQESTAFAFTDPLGRLAPRATISIGMIRKLIEASTDAIRDIQSLDAVRGEITSLPQKNGVYITNRSMEIMSRVMDATVSTLGLGKANLQYAAALLFVCAHEISHIAFDRYDLPETEKLWPELRADLFGIIAAELITNQKASQEMANERVLFGGFRTQDVDTILRVASDAGFEAFFTTYQTAGLREKGGDATHLTVQQRKELMEPAYKKLFARKSIPN